MDGSSGESAEGFDELAALWAEAFLSGELTAAERDHWEARFADWQENLADYGVDDAFVLAETALQEGWDAPDLARVLRGDAAQDGVGSLVTLPGLIAIRLRVLERQGRSDEYLRLAAATGRRAAYAEMLLRLGRTTEALAYGTSGLKTPEEAQALAQALYAQAAITEAIGVAEHGLTLQTPRIRYGPAGVEPDDEADGPPYDDAEIDRAQDFGIAPGADYPRATLARWLRDVAQAEGQPAVALRAAVQIVRDDPTLADYLAAEALAGEAWPALREELLAHVRGLTTYNAPAKVDIFLHEGLLDDAVAVADAAPYHREMVEQVADAVITSHPGWVIKLARAQTHAIIEGGNSGRYDAAARWLARWRDAARASGDERAWRAYLDEVMLRHRRKYKLIPLLQALLN